MARTINAGDTKVLRRDVFAIDPEQIVVNPQDNGRSEPLVFSNVLKYALDFINPEIGQLQAIQCREIEDKRAEIVLGFHRLAAAILVKNGCPEHGIAPHPDFKILTTVEKISEEEGFLRNVVENARRAQTSVIDDASNFRKLKAFGFDIPQIVNAMGKSQQWLEKIESLLTLDKATRSLVHRGEIPVATALELVKLSAEDRKEAIASAKAEAKAVAKDEGSEAATDAVRRSLEKSLTTAESARQSHDAKLQSEAGGKVDAKALRKAVAKKKTAKGEKVTRSITEQRKDWLFLVNEHGSKRVREFAATVVDYINSRKEFDTVVEVLQKLV